VTQDRLFGIGLRRADDLYAQAKLIAEADSVA
jgi:hypothetical protein